MNCPLQYRPRTERIETFTAWRRCLDSHTAEGRPINIGSPDGLSEALSLALQHCSRGDVLFIRAANSLTDTDLVSVYTVQQGKKPTWEPGCAPNRPGPMIGKLVTSMRCAAFEPVEPFDAMKPGADRVNGNAGYQRMVIEGMGS